ncbi:hypothetical protein [Yinghuangia sp. YIM S10712]|uniref:hypothetical protein n=1 Tax=Yinghuangia sp. YIM S10712 TaxID=3436930 RepID=UPI003F52A8C6
MTTTTLPTLIRERLPLGVVVVALTGPDGRGWLVVDDHQDVKLRYAELGRGAYALHVEHDGQHYIVGNSTENPDTVSFAVTRVLDSIEATR